MIKVYQNRNEIYINGSLDNTLIQLNYRGTFVGSLVPDANVVVTRNKIFIFDIKDFDESLPFIYYSGNFRIKGGQYVTTELGTGNISSIEYNQLFRNISDRWDEADNKYEYYSYAGNKYYDNVRTTLDYTYNGENNRWYKFNRIPIGGIPKREQNILKSINERRGLNGEERFKCH